MSSRPYPWSRSDNKHEHDLVQAVLSARKVQVSAQGSKRTVTLSKQNIEDLRKTYEAFKKLVAVEEKWD